jgi:methionyl-tRNA formyltransferase
MEYFTYIFYGSPPLGPEALAALQSYHYPPAAVVNDTKLSLEEHLSLVEEHQPTFLLVAGYGAIIKQALLDTVAGQALNIHPSLLPLYRGAAPVVQAILDGARETGVSVMEMDARMDHGPLLAQEKYPLTGKETPRELYRVLTHRGVELLLENLEDYLAGTLELQPQPHEEATYTKKVSKDDGVLRPEEETAQYMERKIRAYQGWPRTWLLHRKKRLLIDVAHLESENGSVLLVPDQVQPEGGSRMSFAAYCAGVRLPPRQVRAELGLLPPVGD